MAALASELTYPSLLLHVAAFTSGEHKMLIGGEWVSAQSGEILGVIDPATGSGDCPGSCWRCRRCRYGGRRCATGARWR